MGRKIVLLSDGTGNSAAKVWRTNVWRVFESLDLSGNSQVACYDDGVGTSAFKPVAILGGAFGYGLKRNVLDLYKFACRNCRSWDGSDEIYGFGFSRGAFTMRIVADLILDQGLVTADSEPALGAKAKAAYRAYRAKKFHTRWPRFMRPERFGRWLRNLVLRSDYDEKNNRRDVKIRFLGLWDTVAAYGMPVDEMTRGVSQWIWPLLLPDYRLHRDVQRACHALSIDDERTTFHPVLWDESDEKLLAEDKEDHKLYLANERISQVWFPGVHSNVGGGYPDDSVAQIPLIWIMSEAQRCGLQFKSIPDASPQTYGHPATAQDKDGRIYDPRQGLGGYYRYGPRDIEILGKDLLTRREEGALARIHESVMKRIRNRAHAYAPVGLPRRYDLVTTHGQVFPPDQNPYETPAQATARWHGQQQIWNTVWLRRIVYFLTVGVSVYLFAFPLMSAAPPQDEFTTPLRWASDVIRMAESFLPNAAHPWTNGYARQPGRFMAVVAVLAVMLLLGSWLSRRIQCRMDLLWQDAVKDRLTDRGMPRGLLFRVRTSLPYVTMHQAAKKTLAPALFALMFVWLGLTFASHVLFNFQDDAGFVCHETGAARELASGEVLLADGNAVKLSDYQARANTDPTILAADKQNPFKYLAAYGLTLPEFRTSSLCQNMRVSLDRYGKYLVRFESTDSFADRGGEIDAPYGYHSFGVITEPSKAGGSGAQESDSHMSVLNMLQMMALVPLRRELTRPWLRVVARIGGTGGEESFLDPDFGDHYKINETVTATRNGELFLFVNDAVIGIPRLYGWFYGDNQGSTRVLIMRR